MNVWPYYSKTNLKKLTVNRHVIDTQKAPLGAFLMVKTPALAILLGIKEPLAQHV